MGDFFSALFASDFMPHGHCYAWLPEILWLHAGSDLLIAVAYYAIPVLLLYFLRQRKDFHFPGILVLFSAFILLCGTTHLLQIWSIWHGTYRLTGIMKLVTALVSVGTAIVLVPLMPKAIRLPSPTQLREANEALAERTKELEQVSAELEARNRHLQETIADLEVAQEEAAGAARVKDEFLARMSHEMRTPLNAVYGMNELLLETDLTAEQQGYAETVMHSSNALLMQIEEVLDYAAMSHEQAAPALEYSDVCLNALLQEVAAPYASKATMKGLECIVEPPLGIPRVRTDERCLRKILGPMLSNAVKFTEAGSVRLQAHCGPVYEGHMTVKITVRDTGVGISEAQRHEIFQAFRQADNSSRRAYGGLGLGLTMVHQRVQHLEGEMGFESEVGRGTTFWVRLRLAVTAPSAAAATAPTAARNVVLVASEAPWRQAMVDRLTGLGMAVETMASAQQALPRLLAPDAQPEPLAGIFVARDLEGMGGEALLRVLATLPHLQDTPRMLLDDEAAEAPNDELLPVRAVLSRHADAGALRDCLDGPAAPAAPPATRRGLGDDAAPRVLIVEDEQLNQQVLLAMLKALGIQAEVADQGQVALKLLAETPFSLVLMDCQMPVMDGFETTRSIRQREAEGDRPPIPIIAVTGQAHASDRKRCLEAGMTDYLAKPLSKQMLQRVLARYVAN